MPFIDLNTNNAANAATNANNSQPIIPGDDSQSTLPTPEASKLDFEKLAAEGALPVLPPKFEQTTPATPEVPAVNTLDLTADTLTVGNNIREVQGAQFDADVPASPASEPVASDPVMETVPAPTATELGNNPPTLVDAQLTQPEVVSTSQQQDEDLDDLLNTLKNNRPNLADLKPANPQSETQTATPAADTTSMPPTEIAPVPATEQTTAPSETAQSVVAEQSLSSTNAVEPTNIQADNVEDDSGFKLGIESSPKEPSSAVEIADTPVEETPASVVEPVAVAAPSEVPTASEPETKPDSETTAVTPEIEQIAEPTLQQETQTDQAMSEPAPAIPIVDLSVAQQVEGDLQSKSYTLQDMLAEAVNMGASDLHLTANYRAMARVDGKLAEIRSQILQHEDILTMLSEIVAEHKHVDLQHDLDIDISYQIDNPTARFRVNIFYQQGTIGAVFRVIPEHIRTVEELKLPPVIKEFTTLPQGLVLVTGPTGSGKTTTLAALINQINLTEPKHIITIEDPIEYVYPKGVGLVDQRAVYIDTPDWHTALRAVLRQDPNVVLIGEMRDTETMEAALTIAETGHLVFSTLHTNSAAQTVDRIIDAFPEEKQAQVRTQLASVLMAVVSQRLVPISGGGRRVVTELLVVTPAVKNAIREQKVYQIDNIIQTSAELGMHTLEKSLVNLVREGVISPELAQSMANRPDDVMTYLSKN